MESEAAGSRLDTTTNLPCSSTTEYSHQTSDSSTVIDISNTPATSVTSPRPRVGTTTQIVSSDSIAYNPHLIARSPSVVGGTSVTGSLQSQTTRDRDRDRDSGSTFSMKMSAKMGKKVVSMILRAPKTSTKKVVEGVGLVHSKVTSTDHGGSVSSSGVGEASIYHALVVIFLEFFAWGLLTSPMISVLNVTFPQQTFLMNGLIVGIKGILSFLAAPLVGALSDIWGRKFFLLVTVFFTCAPIPLMKINPFMYFAMVSISGMFAVTFSVVFAYVADVTEEGDRSAAYGLVSATFAASLVTSPALGAYIEQMYR